MPFVALHVHLDISGSRTKDVLVILYGRISVTVTSRIGIRPTADTARIAPARNVVIRIEGAHSLRTPNSFHFQRICVEATRISNVFCELFVLRLRFSLQTRRVT